MSIRKQLLVNALKNLQAAEAASGQRRAVLLVWAARDYERCAFIFDEPCLREKAKVCRDQSRRLGNPRTFEDVAIWD